LPQLSFAYINSEIYVKRVGEEIISETKIHDVPSSAQKRHIGPIDEPIVKRRKHSTSSTITPTEEPANTSESINSVIQPSYLVCDPVPPDLPENFHHGTLGAHCQALHQVSAPSFFGRTHGMNLQG
jgi:hypothetical protein